MTIGDEKVRRYEPRMIGIEDRPHEAGMYADLHGHYVLHSAYAELAADRDLWRSMATFEGKVSASVLDDLHTTQAQLAELRGRLEGLASEYAAEAERHLMHAANKDWAEWVRADHSSRASELNGAAREIRTLAAADGATTGETK